MKVAEDVLAVLSRCRTAGNAVHLPEQLDRKLYVAVNKVLEALGSKWNRKAQAHLLAGDAEGVLDTVLLTGTVTIASDEFGLFETPPPLADRLVNEIGVEVGHRVLEPSAGNGRIALAVLRREPDVTLHAVEIQPQCATQLIGRGESLRRPGENIVYIEYLGVAPWNQPPQRRIRGVGTVLLERASDIAATIGFGGTIGLDSKDQAVGFYRRLAWLDEMGPHTLPDGTWVYFEGELGDEEAE